MHPVIAQLAQYDYTYNSSSSAATAAGGIFLVFIFIFYGVCFALAVLHFISLYNWGTSDSMFFENGKEAKTNWFWIISFVPFGSAVYFFTTRKKVIAAKKAYKQTQQPTQSPFTTPEQPMGV